MCHFFVLTTFWCHLWSIYWTDARQLGIYLLIYPITESIYEIIAKYQAYDDQCCCNWSRDKQSHWFEVHYDLLLTNLNLPIMLSQYTKSVPKYQANDDPCTLFIYCLSIYNFFLTYQKGKLSNLTFIFHHPLQAVQRPSISVLQSPLHNKSVLLTMPIYHPLSNKLVAWSGGLRQKTPWPRVAEQVFTLASSSVL